MAQKKKPVKTVTAEDVSETSGSGGSVLEDQKKRGYYYDDSHGYQKFDPDVSDDDDDLSTEAEVAGSQ